MNKEYQSSFLVDTKPAPRVCAFINSGNDHMIQNQVIDNPLLIKIAAQRVTRRRTSTITRASKIQNILDGCMSFIKIRNKNTFI